MPTARTLLRALVSGGVALGLAVPASAATAEPSLEEIRQQIQKSSAELERIVEDYNTVKVQLAGTRRAAADAAARLAPLQAQLDAAAASLGELAADAYRTGQFAAVSALLDSGSSGALLDRVSALDQVARARNSEVADVISARAEVEQQKRKLDSLLAAETAAQQTLAARKAQIEKDLDRLYDLRRQAYGSATESASSAPTPTAPAVSGNAGVAVRYAYGELGKPYVWGADGPEGYDCSGLTLAAWRAAGVALSHSASIQYRETARISRTQLRPGDLVFYSGLGHVAIYVGSGKIIHSPTFGEVVKISSVDIMPPYGYGRPG